MSEEFFCQECWTIIECSGKYVITCEKFRFEQQLPSKAPEYSHELLKDCADLFRFNVIVAW